MKQEGERAESREKAQKMVDNMSLEEKVILTTGGSLGNGCHGSISEMKRLDFPGLCLADAANGLRATDFVSSFPSGIHAGASWNQNLTYHRASAMGAEFKRKGVNVLLGPVVGPLGRVVLGGRNWEGFGADPYLAGSLAYKTVEGIQDRGVITSTKHFIGNEQETNRNPKDDVQSVSSNIDDKTMHELYLWPFQDALKAGSGAIMCSYQRVNNSYGCANSKILNGLLKTELGFQGFVVSDWGAQHAGVATALSGMDMTMPDGGSFWGDKLVESVQNKTVPESRVNDMVLRILTTWYHWKQDTEIEEPGKGMPQELNEPHEIVDARDLDDRQILLDGAIEGHVLVKNTKNTLPLKGPKQLSIYGYSAKSPDVFAPVKGSEEKAYKWEFGAEPVTGEEVFAGFSGKHFPKFSTIGDKGTMLNGGGSASTTPALFASPFEALKMKALQTGTALFHDFESDDPFVSAASDACIVFGNAWASESYDRPALRDDRTDNLIKSVADQCNQTVVVLHNAGVRLVDKFVDHPNVTAIIYAHLPGQESGTALTHLLFGDSNFSGKLPYTVAKEETDYGSLQGPSLPTGKYVKFPQSDFDEGTDIDYRYFDAHDITPRYEFGFGLSYTTFDFTNMTIQRIEGPNMDQWPSGTVAAGGQEDLWDPIFNITASIENTGDLTGAEVAQLYLGIPNAAPKQLRGFHKMSIEPGSTSTAQFQLARRDLSVWDIERQAWHLQRGEYKVYVGPSSRNLPLQDIFTV